MLMTLLPICVMILEQSIRMGLWLDNFMEKQKQSDLMEKIVSLCKRRGFVFPGSEIYGGLSGFWDYGHYGLALKENIKQLWWKQFVLDREDMFGMDAGILMREEVWQARGHAKGFGDPMGEC